MVGSVAERNLLGALILSPKMGRFITGQVSDRDFADGRLGAAYTGITNMMARGEEITPETVANRFTAWDIRGLSTVAPYEWASADVLPHIVTEYAQAVRDASFRRTLHTVAVVLQESLADGGAAPADIAARVITQLSELVDGASTGELATKRLREVLDGSDEYDWLVPGLLERRDRLILTGAEGAGKTTFVRQLAVLSAAGIHPTLFTRIDPVRVLIVDAENTEQQWRRAVRWMVSRAKAYGTADPADTIHIVAGKRVDITRGTHLAEVHRLVDRHKPDILFIGPLYKLVPRAINNDDDAAPLIVALDSLRDRGIALVMEAHAGHALGAGGERDLRPRGSSALLGWPEFGMGLRPVTDDPDMVSVVRWRGDRDSRDWPRHMRRGGDWPWTPSLRAD